MAHAHPLKDKWSLMYLPAVTPEIMNSEFGGNYTDAVKAKMKDVGILSTLEELCSTSNVLPRVSAFPANDTLIYARNGIFPTMESFSAGAMKCTIDCMEDTATKKAMQTLLMLIIGNYLDRLAGENPCNVIRMSHRPSMKSTNLVRFEIWMEKPADDAKLVRILKEQLGELSLSLKPMK